jgi:hypothetical protein
MVNILCEIEVNNKESRNPYLEEDLTIEKLGKIQNAIYAMNNRSESSKEHFNYHLELITNAIIAKKR